MRPATALRIRWLLIALALDVGVYVALSIGGRYGIARSGRLRYDSGLSISDLEVWQPRFCRRHDGTGVDGSWTFDVNPLGTLFAPLILVDGRSSIRP